MGLPNVLWFCSDEQRPDSLSCYGSAWAKTPNIERIASRGTVFHNAVCPSPMCLPSRSSVLSARYPQEFSCLNNSLSRQVNDFPDGYETFPEVLSREGYETVNFGRFNCLRQSVFERNEQTGDYLSEYTDHFSLNTRYDETTYHVLKRPGPDNRPLIIAGTYPGESNPNQISTDRAIDFLEGRTAGAPPFLLRVSFNQPHTPTLAPNPYDSIYDPDELPVRFFDANSLESRSEFDRRYASLHRMDLLTEEQYRQVWKDYMGLCAYIDSELGRVLDALEDAGLRENTLIFYSTDHGKSLGEWGSGEKGTFDSEVWRVPFVWSLPGRIPEGARVETPCGTIDTARTLLSLLGIANRIPDTFRGTNLFAAEGDRESATPASADRNDFAFGVIRPPIEDWPELDPRLMRVAVRSSRFRLDLDWHTDGSPPPENRQDGSLYDLERDPLETRNLWASPQMGRERDRLVAAIQSWIDRYPPGAIAQDPSNAGTHY